MPVLTCSVENLAGISSGEAIRFEVDDVRASGADATTLIGNNPIVRVYPVAGVYTTPNIDPGPVVMCYGPYRKRFTVPSGPGPIQIVPLLLLESVDPPPADWKSLADQFYDPLGAAAAVAEDLATPDWGAIANKPTTFPPAAHTHGVGDLTATGTKDGTKFLRDDNTWVVPTNTTYSAMSVAEAQAQTATTTRGVNASLLKQILWWYLTGNTGTAPGATGQALMAAATAAAAKTALALAKADVGLGNVDNTSDAAKPVSTAQAAADALRQLLSEKNQPNGYAGLDGSGFIPAGLIPGSMDDVLEYANLAAFPVTGVAGKLYTAQNDNRVYRWSGSTYIEISPSPGSTDAVPEGSLNLYYTQARADARAAAALAARTMTAGTGLTGGGTLAADRVFTVNYGTTAGTAAAGNDARLSDQRVPTDNSVTSAKIVDGTIVDGDISPTAGIVKTKLAAAVQTSLGLADTATQPAGLSSAIAAAQLIAIRTITGTTDTPTIADQSKALECTNAAAVTITVPTDATQAFPVGSVMEVRQIGAGQVTIVGAGGVTVNGAAATFKTRAQWSPLTLVKRAADTWFVAGDLA